MSMGRMDQYLAPYYERDIAAGVLTDDEARELLSLMMIKMNAVINPQDGIVATMMTGSPCMQGITIGGCTRAGEDAVNAVSYLILDAERAVGLTGEDVVVRIHPKNPPEFVRRACQVARDLGGKLKFVGDATTIANLEYDGVPTEVARDYAIAGCTSPEVGGTVHNVPGGIISAAGILELALNNGVQRLTGLKLGVETGDAAQFDSFEAVWNAFETQVRHVIPFCHAIKNADKATFAAYRPSPFESALSERCIQRGQDITRGGTAPFLWFAMSVAGLPNVGNSLAAIKKWVFEEKKVTMQEVLDALAVNFEGHEDLLFLMRRAPKWGNDDPYVDELVNRAVRLFSEVVEETPGYAGAKSTIAAAAVTANVGLGMCLGATPEGRLAGESLADGGISPTCGTNDSGMTATMMSIAHLPHQCLRHGEVLNIRLDPDAVNTDAKLEKFASLIRSYIKAGGFLVQFNIVGTDTLKDAMIHPENHRDLVVRVATYAAYFIELGSDLQNDIIRRMEFESV